MIDETYSPPQPSPTGEGDLLSLSSISNPSATNLSKVTNNTPSPVGEGRDGVQGGIIWGKAAEPLLWELARENRKHPTEAEHIIWEHLRGKATGVKFRRQQVVGNYIVDFICIEKKLVIEIDGGYHHEAEQEAYDRERTAYLESIGLTVLRFENEEVTMDTDNVLQRIKNYIIKELI